MLRLRCCGCWITVGRNGLLTRALLLSTLRPFFGDDDDDDTDAMECGVGGDTNP